MVYEVIYICTVLYERMRFTMLFRCSKLPRLLGSWTWRYGDHAINGFCTITVTTPTNLRLLFYLSLLPVPRPIYSSLRFQFSHFRRTFFNNVGMSFSAQPLALWPETRRVTYSNILPQVMLLVNTRWKPNLSLDQPRVLYVYST